MLIKIELRNQKQNGHTKALPTIAIVGLVIPEKSANSSKISAYLPMLLQQFTNSHNATCWTFPGCQAQYGGSDTHKHKQLFPVIHA